jgi:hypothetical protein
MTVYVEHLTHQLATGPDFVLIHLIEAPRIGWVTNRAHQKKQSKANSAVPEAYNKRCCLLPRLQLRL